MIYSLAEYIQSPEIQANNIPIPKPKLTQTVGIWRPARVGSLQINSDTSFHQATGKVFGGYIIRDHEGILTSGNTFKGLANSALMAETLVLRDAMIFAENLRLDNLIFESDNLVLIQACRGDSEVRSILNIIHDIRILRSHFRSVSFTWVSRDGNQGAHLVAEQYCLNNLPLQWFHFPPTVLKAVLCAERARVVMDNG